MTMFVLTGYMFVLILIGGGIGADIDKHNEDECVYYTNEKEC